MNIYTHSDADGIASAALYTLFLMSKNEQQPQVFFPKVFGEVENSSEYDVMLDMKPVDPNFTGLVFDHHKGHPSKKERKYTLVRKQLPTSMIIYRSFEIPVEHIWKVAVGITGDGQAELIDLPIFQHFPILLESEERITKYGTRYFIPVTQSLSTLINSACRANFPELGFRKLFKAQKIEDILSDHELRKLKEMISFNTFYTLQNFPEQILSHNIIYLSFESSFSLSGRLASTISMKKNTTVIAVNTKDGKLSIRGMLADFIENKLKEKKEIVSVGGHAGFKGGTVDITKISQFENFLKETI